MVSIIFLILIILTILPYIIKYFNTNIGIVTTVAGNVLSGFSDGYGTQARFNGPYGITVDPWNNVFVTDYYNHAIRKVSASGNVITIAGSPPPLVMPGFAEGVGTSTLFSYPAAVLFSDNGYLYIADSVNHRIRYMNTTTGT